MWPWKPPTLRSSKAIFAASSADGSAARRWPTFDRTCSSRSSVTPSGFVTLVPLPDGGVGATWLDGRNMVEGKEEGDMTIRYATIDAAGVIRSDVQLDDRTCECCTTGMAMSSGRPVIAYRDRSLDEVRDIAVVRQTMSGWSKPRLLHADGWKIAGCPVNGPQVDAHGKRVVAAWFIAAADHGRAYVVFSDDAGATFGTPIVIDDGKPVGRVDVAMLDSDSAIATWSEQTARAARSFAPGASPEPAIRGRPSKLPIRAPLARRGLRAWPLSGRMRMSRGRSRAG
jgi:hypothetical protein